MCNEVTTQGKVLLCQQSASLATLANRVTVPLHATALPLPAVKKHTDKIEITVFDFFLLKPPTKMEQTECSKMSAHKIQMSGNYPKQRILQ
jgi:hypothetical protein